MTGAEIAYQEWKTRFEMRYIAVGSALVFTVMLLGFARVI